MKAKITQLELRRIQELIKQQYGVDFVGKGKGETSDWWRDKFGLGNKARETVLRHACRTYQLRPGGTKDGWAQRAAKNMGSAIKSQEFFNTPAWRAVRYEALKRDGGRCQLCGNGRAEGALLHVDHIKPRSKYPELSLELGNLQTLCQDCNLGKSNTDETDWR